MLNGVECEESVRGVSRMESVRSQWSEWSGEMEGGERREEGMYLKEKETIEGKNRELITCVGVCLGDLSRSYNKKLVRGEGRGRERGG
jgi:hypothetical protein